MAKSLVINTQANSPKSSLFQGRGTSLTSPGTPPEFTLGDPVPLNLYFELADGTVDTATNTGSPSIQVGLGIPGSVPTAGTYTLTFSGQTTTALAFNANAAAVQAALVALSSIGASNVVVNGLFPDFEVQFIGTLAAASQALMTSSATLLFPISDVNIGRVVAGSASPAQNEIQAISIAQQPVSFQNAFSTITESSVIVGFSGTLSMSTDGLSQLYPPLSFQNAPVLEVRVNGLVVYSCGVQIYNRVIDAAGAGQGPVSNTARGIASIGNGANTVTVSGLGLGGTPVMVQTWVEKPNAGLNIFSTVDASTITSGGFSVDLSGNTDTTTYKLGWVAYFLVMFMFCMGVHGASTPLLNPVLQSDMNGAGHSITNAAFVGNGAGLTNVALGSVGTNILLHTSGSGVNFKITNDTTHEYFKIGTNMGIVWGSNVDSFKVTVTNGQFKIIDSLSGKTRILIEPNNHVYIYATDGTTAGLMVDSVGNVGFPNNQFIDADGSFILGAVQASSSGDLMANTFIVNSGPTVIDVNGNFVGSGTNQLQKNTTNAITGGVGVGSAIIPVLNMTRQTGLFNSTAASNSVPALGGQMGYWYDVNTNQWSLFMSRTNGTNWDAWNPVLGIPEGIFAIGSPTNMNRFITGSVQVYVNGATNNQTIARRDADGVYVFNDPNPYSSGSGVSAAMYQTNSTGVGSTLGNQFAIEMLATPNGGSTNNLPNHVQIVTSGFPFALAATGTVSGKTGNYSTIIREIDGIERHPQWIGGKFLPGQAGYVDGYSYDPNLNTYTNNAGTAYFTGLVSSSSGFKFSTSTDPTHGPFPFDFANGAGIGFYYTFNGLSPNFEFGFARDNKKIFHVGTDDLMTVDTNLTVSGTGGITVTAGTYTGNGTNLTNLPPAAIQYRAGFSNLASASVSQAILFVVPFPASVGTNYTPSVSFLGSALVGAVTPSYNSITTNGFTVNLSVGITGGENFGWTATPWTTPSR